MESIKNSFYSDEFDDIVDSTIFLLSKNEANTFWANKVGQSGASFMTLPDNHWLVTGQQKIIGRWMEDFNANNSNDIQNILNNEIQWPDSSLIRFCISKDIIIESEWQSFKKNWINFIYCDDDCPIILNMSNSNIALIFRPIGDIVLASKN